MVMFTAYFDDSGSEETPALAVAGYISTAEQWIKFEQEWKEILAEYQVTTFHMSEFAQSVGEFGHLQGKEADRKRLLERLIGTIRVRVHMSFACILSPKDFDVVNASYLLRESLGNAYSFCGRYCAGRVRQWATKYNYPLEQIVYFFETGTKGKGDLIDVMKRDGFAAPNFGPKTLAPLQAADFVAWELRKHAGLAYSGELDDFRKSFRQLSRIPQDWGIYVNQEALEEFCKQAPIPKRQSQAIQKVGKDSQ